MNPPDDIRAETPSSETKRIIIKRNEARPHRSIGPESKARGVPEAYDETPAAGR